MNLNKIGYYMKHFKYIAILFAWFAVACTTDDLGETVHRGNQVIIPDGNACIQQGDNVIVVTTHKNFDDLTDIIV